MAGALALGEILNRMLAVCSFLRVDGLQCERRLKVCSVCVSVSKPKPALGKKLMAGKKKTGLGVKKMTTKVDESLFDQAPEEVAPPIRATVSYCSLEKPLRSAK